MAAALEQQAVLQRAARNLALADDLQVGREPEQCQEGSWKDKRSQATERADRIAGRGRRACADACPLCTVRTCLTMPALMALALTLAGASAAPEAAWPECFAFLEAAAPRAGRSFSLLMSPSSSSASSSSSSSSSFSSSSSEATCVRRGSSEWEQRWGGRGRLLRG